MNKPEADTNGSATEKSTPRDNHFRIHIEGPPDVEIIQQYDLAPIVVAYSTGKEKEIDAKGTASAGCHGIALHGLHLRWTLTRCGNATGGPAALAGHYRTGLTE
jgi:hypothetical protein